MKRFNFLKLAAAGMVAVAISSGCATKVRQAEQSDERVEAATRAFGPGFEYMIVGSASSGLADKAFLGLYRTGASSDLARELATRLAAAEKKYLRFMVTGENAEKTAHVIVEALEFHVKGGLPNLELLYLGQQQHVGAIDKAVKRVGGRLRFAPYPPA